MTYPLDLTYFQSQNGQHYILDFSSVSAVATSIARAELSVSLMVLCPQRNSVNDFIIIEVAYAVLIEFIELILRFSRRICLMSRNFFFFHFHQSSRSCLFLMSIKYKPNEATMEGCWHEMQEVNRLLIRVRSIIIEDWLWYWIEPFI